MPETQGQVIQWSVVTHVHKERSVDWYWAFGLIIVAAAAVSLWVGNILFALILIVGAGSIGMLLVRGPREHEVRIDNRGINIDGTLYPFKTIKSFWVEESRLYLTTSGIVSPYVTLPLDSNAHAGQIRSYLKRVVPEVEQFPHLGEHLAELLGL